MAGEFIWAGGVNHVLAVREIDDDLSNGHSDSRHREEEKKKKKERRVLGMCWVKQVWASNF